MKLSSLQKYILLRCYERGGRVDRKIFRNFYIEQALSTKEKYHEGIITKSLESLIDRELMTGFGRRTSHKWFMTHIKLTKKGKLSAEEVLRESQKKLPL